MNEYERLGKLAVELREKYPPGTRIELIHMADEIAPVEDGTRGTVRFIDDIGQIHMLWDNKRTLAINTDTDSFRALTEAECYEEECQKKSERFYAVFNACGGEQNEAIDRALSARIIPSAVIALNGADKLENKNLSEKLGMIFGEDNVEISCASIKASGTSVL